MGTLQIPTYPEKYGFSGRLEWDGKVYVLHWRWRQRCESWYVDVHDSNDVPVLRGARASPGWTPFAPYAVDAPALFSVDGRDDFERLDLGVDLLPLLFQADTDPGADVDVDTSITVTV